MLLLEEEILLSIAPILLMETKLTKGAYIKWGEYAQIVCLFVCHTDQILVEMFHNYASKECLSVKKLKLWLLILTKTLF